MPHHRVPPESLAGQAPPLAPAFECSWRDAGLDAAWVHLAGELDVDTTPQLERTLRDPHSQARLVVLAPVDPSVQALLRLGDRDGAS
jgi:hypothetical protein